jgi:hypothetical protein
MKAEGQRRLVGIVLQSSITVMPGVMTRWNFSPQAQEPWRQCEMAAAQASDQSVCTTPGRMGALGSGH